MRKRYFFIFTCLLSGLIASAQYTPIPDPVFEQALINRGYDTTLDGQVLTANISGITTLDVSGPLVPPANYAFITDLTGIRSFTSLRELKCNYQRITALDLNGMTQLQRVEVGSTQLISANLTGLNQLTTLILRGALPSVSLNGLIALKTLDLASNRLTAINLNGLSQLEYLSLGGNQLTSLDVSMLAYLKFLSAPANALTSVSLDNSNIAANTPRRPSNRSQRSASIPQNISLIEIDLSNNQLSQFSLNCTGALDKVNLHHNILQSINLQSNTVRILNCAYNQLTSLPLSGTPALKELICSNNSLTSLQLQAAPQLIYVDCEINQITPTIDLSGLPVLTQLQARFNQMNQNLDLSPAIQLVGVDVSNNQIPAIVTSGLNRLRNLNVSYNQLSALPLTGLTALEDLDASYNRINTPVYLDQATAIKRATLNNNLIPSLTTTGLGALEYLRCNFNRITALSLSGLVRLKELYAADNLIASAIDISSAPVIEIVDLKYNRIPGNIVLDGMQFLKELYCDHNNLVTFKLLNLPQLTYFNARYNAITEMELNNLPSVLALLFEDNPIASFKAIALPLIQQISTSGLPLTYAQIENLAALTQFSSSGNTVTVAAGEPMPDSVLKLIQLPVLAQFDATYSNWSEITISNLPLLTEFNANNNRLKVLALSQLPLLHHFDASDNLAHPITVGGVVQNPLMSLTVSNLNSLHHFDASNSNIGTFVHNNLPALYSFDISGNRLTDLSINSYANLHDFNASSNQLVNFTLRSLPMLVDFTVANNAITNFDLGFLPALAVLDNHNFGGNPLHKFLLTNIPLVTTLSTESYEIQEQQLTSMQGLTQVVSRQISLVKFFGADLPQLQSLDLSNCRLTQFITAADTPDPLVGAVLSNTPSLTTINIRQNVVMKKLKLHGLPLLNYFDCSDNGIEDISLAGLPALPTFDSFNFDRPLCVGGNCFGFTVDVNNPFKKVYIESLPLVPSLQLDNRQVKDLTVKSMSALQFITANNNVIDNVQLVSLPQINRVALNNNQLTTFDFSQLSSLKTLYVNYNLLVNQPLIHNGIQTLDISSNALVQFDAHTFTQLKWFDCSNNTAMQNLDIKNGNNTLLVDDNGPTFYATGNSSLRCIKVDSTTYSRNNWSNRVSYPVTRFSKTCTPPNITYAQSLRPGVLPVTSLCVGTPFTIDKVTISDIEDIYTISISPALPYGLAFDDDLSSPTVGRISGTPVFMMDLTTYTITVSGAYDFSFDIAFEINAVAEPLSSVQVEAIGVNRNQFEPSLGPKLPRSTWVWNPDNQNIYYPGIFQVTNQAPGCPNSAPANVDVRLYPNIQTTALPTLDTPIRAQQTIPTSSQYRFEVSYGGQVEILDRNSNTMQLSNLPGGAQYDTTYAIRAALKIGDEIGPFGPVQLLTTPFDPQTSELIASQQGTTLSDINNPLYNVIVPGATGYQYKVENGASAIIYDTTTNSIQLTSQPSISYNTTYNVSIAARFNGTYRNYGQSYAITTPARPGTTPITAPACGSILGDIWTLIRCAQVYGATAYQFTFTRNGSSISFTSATNSMSVSQLTGWVPNATYTVDVKVQANGIWGLSGQSCQLTMPSAVVNGTAVLTNCGGQMSSMDLPVYCTNLYSQGAQAYRFEVSANGNTQTIESNNNSFYITALSGGASYNTTYSVRVAVKFNGQFGAYGTTCTIKTPAAPLGPDITAPACNSTLSSIWTVIRCRQVTGAENYRFTFTQGATSLTFVTSANRMQLASLVGRSLNTTYTVTAAAQVNGVWGPEGPACTLTSPATNARMAEDVDTEFVVKALPNPFDSNFTLLTRGGGDSPVEVRVYDMTGRLVESLSATPEGLEERALGENYATGVYNIVLTRDENTKVIRVVKR